MRGLLRMLPPYLKCGILLLTQGLVVMVVLWVISCCDTIISATFLLPLKGGGGGREGLYFSPHDCFPMCPIGPQVVPDYPYEAAQSHLVPACFSPSGDALVYKRPVLFFGKLLGCGCSIDSFSAFKRVYALVLWPVAGRFSGKCRRIPR